MNLTSGSSGSGKQTDCRMNLKPTETEYLIYLISRDNDGLQVLRASLMKKLLVIQQRQESSGNTGDDYAQLFTEGVKLKPVQAIMQPTSDEQKVEDLMRRAMNGELISSEDKQWYKQKLGWDLI
jgi:hypothetical protein